MISKSLYDGIEFSCKENITWSLIGGWEVSGERIIDIYKGQVGIIEATEDNSVHFVTNYSNLEHDVTWMIKMTTFMSFFRIEIPIVI